MCFFSISKQQMKQDKGMINQKLSNRIRGAEPFMKNVAIYRISCQAASQKGLNKTSNLPCMMMNLFGPHVGICGGILSNEPTVQWLSPIYSLPHEEDEEAFVALARFFKSTKIAINSLFQYYLQDFPQGGFPDVFQCEHISFQYVQPILQHAPRQTVLFLATTDGKPCVIKFTRTYGFEPHKLMAAARFAPNLLGFKVLNHRWKIVVMEYLDPENWVGLDVYSLPFYGKTVDEAQRVLQNLHKALKVLHQAGYAHGDFRSNNILVHKKELSIRIIDWDWSEKNGEAIYPPSINMELIKWPTGVAPGSLMKLEHDLEWYNRIKMDIDNSIQNETKV